VKYTVSLGNRNYFELFLAKVFHNIMNRESQKMISFNFFRVFLLTANVSAVQCSLILQLQSVPIWEQKTIYYTHIGEKTYQRLKKLFLCVVTKNSYFVRLMKRMFQIYFEMKQTIKEASSTCFGETLLKKKIKISYKKMFFK
jgi:hypothetical protein